MLGWVILWCGTSAAFFGDEDTPVTWIILNIEFLEDFIQDCSCGGTITDSHNSSLSILANEFSAILPLLPAFRESEPVERDRYS